MTGRMLIAGVGNIFLSDDGFGVEVARRLAGADLPDEVRVADYGISGMHLAYDLAEGYETTILIDATPRGGEPGTVYVLEVDPAGRADAPHPAQAHQRLGPATGETPLLNAHGMQPDVVFSMLDMLGADAGRVIVIGCEPATVDEGIGLSTPVTAAVDEAVRVVLGLVRAAGEGGRESRRGPASSAYPDPHAATAGGPPAAGPGRE